jgi:uncharacterized protein with von Willebrand factor type A (vWA) domain
MNEEPGYKWMQRMTETFEKVIWLNPTPEKYWNYTKTIEMTHELVDKHMYPLTLQGLEDGIKYLTK